MRAVLSRVRRTLLSTTLCLSTLAATAQEPVREDDTLGSASELRIESRDAESVTVEPGIRLHEAPHQHSAVVSVVDVEMPVVPLDRTGDWALVRYAGRVGWAFLGDVEEPELPEAVPIPPPPEAPPPPRLESLEPDAERLRRALDFLDRPNPSVDTGIFEIHSDLKKKRGLKLSHQVAETLPESYQERFGLSPVRPATFAVVIFDRERDYRRFESEVSGLADLDAAGHAGSGVAALVAGQRTTTEVASLLVHELTHLLNRRSFLGTPPPWLEEGMANDLAYSRFDAQGSVVLGTLGGRSFMQEIPAGRDRFGRYTRRGTYHVQGPQASLNLLKRAILLEEVVPLELLLDLTWSEFVDPDGRELRYVQSAFLVRYLLEGRDPARFRGFLKSFQEGGSAATSELLRSLELDLEALREGFHGWVLDHRGDG